MDVIAGLRFGYCFRYLQGDTCIIQHSAHRLSKYIRKENKGSIKLNLYISPVAPTYQVWVFDLQYKYDDERIIDLLYGIASTSNITHGASSSKRTAFAKLLGYITCTQVSSYSTRSERTSTTHSLNTPIYLHLQKPKAANNLFNEYEIVELEVHLLNLTTRYTLRKTTLFERISRKI